MDCVKPKESYFFQDKKKHWKTGSQFLLRCFHLHPLTLAIQYHPVLSQELNKCPPISINIQPQNLNMPLHVDYTSDNKHRNKNKYTEPLNKKYQHM